MTMKLSSLKLMQQRQFAARTVSEKRAIKPEQYNVFGIINGCYETPDGEWVDVEQFYTVIGGLAIGFLDDSIRVASEPDYMNNRRLVERLRTNEVRLIFLYEVLIGESSLGVVFPTAKLIAALNGLDAEEFEDLFTAYDFCKPEQFDQNIALLYDSVYAVSI